MAWQQTVFLFGRAVLASLFILAGVSKIFGYADVAARMEAVGLTPSNILLPATIALELGGGLTIALGLRGHQVAAAALAIFTLATNWYFHRFWELEGDLAAKELSLFFKNVAIAGALTMVAAWPGKKA